MHFGRRSEGVKSLHGTLGKPEGIVGYLGKYMRLLVCVFPFCSLSDLGIIIFLFSTDGVSSL